MQPCLAIFVALFVTAPITVLGFVVPIGQSIVTTPTTLPTSSSLHGIDPTAASLDVLNIAQSLWISTIDGDIDKIPVNEFATVFAGGIVVMLGGLISALVVGAILEKGDLYAKLASESYIRNAEDEEFLKNMSEDEKKKTQAMLSKIKKSKEEGVMDEKDDLKDQSAINDKQTKTTIQVVAPQLKEKEAATASSDLFSDYGD